MNCDCIDGSLRNGKRQQFLDSFALDKPPVLKDLYEPETIHFLKSKKSVSTNITFCLEGADRRAVDFNGETLTLKSEDEKDTFDVTKLEV